MASHAAAIFVSQSACYKRTKHIGIRSQHIRNLIEKRVILINIAPWANQLIDYLTKFSQDL